MSQGAPCVPVNVREYLRCLCNGREGNGDLVEKFGTQPGPLLLMPSERIVHVPFRFRSEPDRDGHSLRRISAITSAAKRPRMPSAS